MEREERGVASVLGPSRLNGPRAGQAPSRWPLALLLLCAFLGHDLFMAQVVSARPASGAIATHDRHHHADHRLPAETSVAPSHAGGSAETPPSSHHVADCGEGRDVAASSYSDDVRLTRHVPPTSPAATPPGHVAAGGHSAPPVPPAAVRRAFLQVFLN